MQTDGQVHEELARLRARVDELESERRTTRRRALGLAGAAVVGGTALLLASSGASAAAGGPFLLGVSNTADSSGTNLTSASGAATLNVTNSFGSTALRGASTSSGTGSLGRIDSPAASGYAFWGINSGTLGYACALEGGQAQLWLSPANSGPSLSVAHDRGEIAFDSTTDSLWLCVADGSPGSWRKLAGSSSAGALHAISPTRVYDSRRPTSNPLATGATRTVNVANKVNLTTGAVVTPNIVPAGATAIAYNLTVVNTVGSNGFLAVNEGGNTTVAASIINWSASGLTLANSSVVKVNASRQVTVICGGTSTSTNFIIDVVGYYL